MGSEHWASSRKAGAAPQCCSQQLLGEQAGRMDNCLVLKGKLDLHGHGALNQSSSKRLSFLLFTLLICLGLHGTEGGTHLDAPWFHWKGGQVRFFFEDMTNAERRQLVWQGPGRFPRSVPQWELSHPTRQRLFCKATTNWLTAQDRRFAPRVVPR